MPLFLRRSLFIAFILLFLSSSSLIILYATGYKLNLKTGRIQKTGALIIDSEPPGAVISLNGKPFQSFWGKIKKEEYQKTPAKIKNLLPGEYEVSLSRAGYWNWNKKLEIKPGQSTFAEDIFLFKKESPEKLAMGEIEELKSNPEKKYLAVRGPEELKILETKNNEIFRQIKIKETAGAAEKISWSPDGKKILYRSSIWEVEKNETLELKNFLPADFLNLKWGENNKIYYQAKEGLFSFDPLTRKNSLILKNGKEKDYLVRGNYLALISSALSPEKLSRLSIFSPEQKELRSINLPYSPAYVFSESAGQPKELTSLYDPNHQTLYLLDPFALSPLLNKIDNLKYFYWIDQNRLLCANDFEIWIFSPAEKTSTFLTRISAPLKQIFWHPSGSYVIYITGNEINVLELDSRGNRQLTALFKAEKIDFAEINDQGMILYLAGQINGEKGLYRLSL